MLPTLRSATRHLFTAMTTQTWQQRATAKRDSVNALIPPEWRIKNPPSREEQKDITGSYIHQFLSKQEVEITETDAVGIAEKTTTGKWTAVDVTKAFCHRAALVHQLVGPILPPTHPDSIHLTNSDKLPPRNLLHPRPHPRRRTRRPLLPHRPTPRTPPRPSHQPQRPIPHPRDRNNNGLRRLDRDT